VDAPSCSQIQQVAPNDLPAVEHHLSSAVEVDYGKKADKFSYKGRYAALLLVQELPYPQNLAITGRREG
jgi:hypothetical protein